MGASFRERFNTVAEFNQYLAVALFWWQVPDEMLKGLTIEEWDKVLSYAEVPGNEKLHVAMEEKFLKLNQHKTLGFWKKVLKTMRPDSKAWCHGYNFIQNAEAPEAVWESFLNDNRLGARVHGVVYEKLLASASTFESWRALYCYARDHNEPTDWHLAMLSSLANEAKVLAFEKWFTILRYMHRDKPTYPISLKELYAHALDQALLHATTFDDLTNLRGFSEITNRPRRMRQYVAKFRNLEGVSTSQWRQVSRWLQEEGKERIEAELHGYVMGQMQESTDTFFGYSRVLSELKSGYYPGFRSAGIVERMILMTESFENIDIMLNILADYPDFRQKYLEQWHLHSIDIDRLLYLFVQCKRDDRVLRTLLLERIVKDIQKEPLTTHSLDWLLRQLSVRSEIDQIVGVAFPHLSFEDCRTMYLTVGRESAKAEEVLLEKAKNVRELNVLLETVPNASPYREAIMTKMIACVHANQLG